ncbi:MAG: PorV/PorQ family protein [Bacteroidales bacterium]|nr:PorV/PorQ family protein [Bacteroidales bacterium]
MKKIYKYLAAFFLIILIAGTNADTFAGNKDRSGQAGASELLINPWARSSGWGGVSTANIRGLESMFGNVAGIAFTQGTELIFSHTSWLKGSGTDLFSFGFTQRISESGVFGMSIMSMGFGDINITTTDHPEGGIGTYSPSLMNVSLSYAKAFSNSIYAGITFKIISESIADISAQGLAIDAGIQYVTGELENIKFGIVLKNVGPTMQFSGDGMSLTGQFFGGNELQFTFEERAADFELPTALLIGAAYDFLWGENNRLTLAGNFTSNSFTKDQFTAGIEFCLKNYLMLRTGYTYEEGIDKDIYNPSERTNANKGPSAGFSVQVPLNKEKGTNFSVDYSFRATDHFNGTHSIGARISL